MAVDMMDAAPSAVDDGEYDDEWEEDDAGKEADPLVHPIERPLDRGDDGKADKQARPDAGAVAMRLKALSVLSDTTASVASDEEDHRTTVSDHMVHRASPIAVPLPTIELDRVQVHARRYSDPPDERRPVHSAAPPPAPMALRSTTQAADIGQRGAQAAARRLREFREREQKLQALKDGEAAALARRRKEVRMANKPFNRLIGVADIPAAERLKALQREQRYQRRLTERKTEIERKSRWYQKVQRSSRSECTTAAYQAQILAEAREQALARQRQPKKQRRSIEKKLHELDLSARQLVAKTAGEYERGSYLLKRQTTRTGTPQEPPAAPTAGTAPEKSGACH